MTCSSGEAEDEISAIESLQFDFGKIRVATQNFSDANKLGEGGFGIVYKVMWHYRVNKYQFYFS